MKLHGGSSNGRELQTEFDPTQPISTVVDGAEELYFCRKYLATVQLNDEFFPSEVAENVWAARLWGTTGWHKLIGQALATHDIREIKRLLGE